MAVWIAASDVFQVVERRGLTGQASASFWGMHLAHFGIAVFVIGVTMVGGFQEEKDVRMTAGDAVSVGGYQLRLLGIREAMGPNYRAVVGDLELSKDGRVLRALHPEKRHYLSSSMPMTEAAIDTKLTRDIYVSLGEPLDKTVGHELSAWSVRVYYKPFVSWIWGGCLLMAVGGFLAVADRRYRLRARAVTDLSASGVAA